MWWVQTPPFVYSAQSLTISLGWLRRIVRLFCGVALVGVSLVIYLHLAWVPLCVSRHEHLAVCLNATQELESCPVFIVDLIDARCTRALTLWAMDPPDTMWEERWDEATMTQRLWLGPDAFANPIREPSDLASGSEPTSRVPSVSENLRPQDIDSLIRLVSVRGVDWKNNFNNT